MKKILIYSLLATVLFGNSGAGCGNNNDDPQPGTGSFVRMTVNGQPWAATSKISGLADKNSVLAPQGIISFSGDMGKENLTVNIYGTQSPGTYTITSQGINGNVAAYMATTDGTNGTYFSTKAPGSNLTVTVTQASSERVSGTFSGTLGLEYALGTGTTGPKTVVITNGEFSATP